MKDLWRLLALMRPFGGWMALGVVLSCVTVLANVTLMAVSGWFIAAMALAGVAGVSMNYFTPAAIIRAMAIVRTAGRYAERLITHEATFRLLAHLREWFYTHLEPLAPARLGGYRSGDMLSRLRADIDALEHFYLRLLVPALVGIVAGLAFCGALWFYSPVLSGIEAALLAIAGVAVPYGMQRLGREASQRQIENAALLRARMVEGLQGQAELAVYGALERHLHQCDEISQSLIDDQRRLSWLRGVSHAALGACAHVGMWAAVVIAGPLVARDLLEGAELAMLTLFMLASFEAVQPLPMAVQTLPSVLTAARRLFEIAETAPAVEDTGAHAPDLPDAAVRFAGVDFAYDTAGPTVLTGIDLELPPGRKVAVVGPTGSGKSSLVNVLLRFWPVRSGRVTLGARAIEEMDVETLRRQFGAVPQNVHVFNTTIRANLLLANPDADDEALRRVCRIVELDDFISDLPEGFDTYVGEAGMKLSGGQIRRLAIARALLKDAPVLILDEPGEGLDPNMEARVVAAILEACRDRSVLLITHSLAGLEQFDEIAVMQAGRIVERGTHHDLLSRGGAYQALQALRQPLVRGENDPSLA